MAIKKISDDSRVVRCSTCTKCGPILEYLPVDIQNRTRTDYDGGSDTYYCIICRSVASTCR